MARALTSAVMVARSILSDAQGWFMFVEISRTDGNFFRLCDNNRHMEANGKIWQAASIKLSMPEENIDGTLGQLTLTIPNVSRLPMAAVEVDGELLGQTVRVWFAHESSLATFDPALLWVHEGAKVKANAAELTLTCGHPSAGKRIPAVRFNRTNFPQLLPQGGVASGGRG